jgi:hypothetical protein
MRNLVKRLRTELFGGTFDTMREAADRVEALEAALRQIADTAAGELTYTGHSPNTRGAFGKINGLARAALEPAPEQDK